METLTFAELGVAGVALGANVFIVINFLKHLKSVNKDHMEIWGKLDTKLDKDIEVSVQNYTLLKNLNDDRKDPSDKRKL